MQKVYFLQVLSQIVTFIDLEGQQTYSFSMFTVSLSLPHISLSSGNMCSNTRFILELFSTRKVHCSYECSLSLSFIHSLVLSLNSFRLNNHSDVTTFERESLNISTLVGKATLLDLFCSAEFFLPSKQCKCHAQNILQVDNFQVSL